VNIHKFLEVIIKPFRLKRMDMFLQRMKHDSNTTILDIGGTEYNWNIVKALDYQDDLLINYTGLVTLLNTREPKQKQSKYNYVIGDATNLNYKDGEFAILIL
jgi:hypothetical protein